LKYSGDELKEDELEEVIYSSTRRATGAAFFDIDGTLIAKPSLERRFFWNLRRQGKIPTRNYLAWLAETARLGLRDFRGPRAAAQSNKKYLRGVTANVSLAGTDRGGVAKSWLPEFFPAAIQRAWWHALRSDAIVLVSGTIVPLAEIVTFALERELLWRGMECRVFALATELEIADGSWTGQVANAAMLREQKAVAVNRFASEQNIPLAHCSAYGDSSQDRWMLEIVGHAFAINPTRRLQRIARSRDWQILHWTHSAVRSASEQHGAKKSLKLKREAAR
jgi:HAD superfamily hydrolase (TIGR01490 family)